MSTATRKWTAGAILALVVGIALFVAGRVGSAEEGLAAAATPALVDDDGYATFVMPVDTPPVAAAGWPFQQLPLVTKAGVPLPRTGLALVPPPAYRAVTIPTPPAPGIPEVTPPPSAGPPLWVLTPLAAGAFVGRGGASAHVPSTVIPEPGTLLLLSTGLALIGVGAHRRRRKPARQSGKRPVRNASPKPSAR